MRKVELQPWRVWFSLSSEGRYYYPFPTHFLSKERRIFNRITILLFLFVTSLILGIFNPAARIFALTELVFLAVLFFQTQHKAQSIYLARKSPHKSVEYSDLPIDLSIENRGEFSIDDLLVVDEFTGSLNQQFILKINEALPPRAKQYFNYCFPCNSGMGPHSLGSLKVYVQDPLGIFTFTVIQTDVADVFVYPYVCPIPDIPIRQGTPSLNYGQHECAMKGLSTNLQGVREYQLGDSFHHISWRLSAKRNTLLVKEFDRMVNVTVSVVLNLDSNLHAGVGAQSTWEYSKDLANSLITQQIEMGNSVSVLTNRFATQHGTGETHKHELISLIAKTTLEPDKNTVPLPRRYTNSFPPGSTIIYVGPFLEKNSTELATSLLELKRIGHDILCYFFEPVSFLDSMPKDWRSILATVRNPGNKTASALAQLSRGGIFFRILEKNEDMIKALQKTPRNRNKPLGAIG